mgnify:CR=1 FL=1
MAQTSEHRRNYQKHTNPNPLHRWLLTRFHRRVAELALCALSEDGWRVAQGAVASKGGAGRRAQNGAPRVLDVGCGEGFVLRYLQQRLPETLFCAVDVDRHALLLARGCGAPGPLLCADVAALPFTSSVVDLVLCLEVLEHLSQPVTGLAELRRVTKGALIISVPNQPHFSLANLARGKNLRHWGDDPEHLQRWRPREFISMLRSDLRVETIVYSFPWVIAVCRE